MKNDAFLRSLKPGVRLIDLTPAAIGPYCIPVVNGRDHLDALNVKMVACGGQATIPMVAAVSRVTRVHYGEIVASISSKSAGPGTRANIDEFTETTSKAIEVVGDAAKGKAIIVLNPAEPPLITRDTVCIRSRTSPTRTPLPLRSSEWPLTCRPTCLATIRASLASLAGCPSAMSPYETPCA